MILEIGGSATQEVRWGGASWGAMLTRPQGPQGPAQGFLQGPKASPRAPGPPQNFPGASPGLPQGPRVPFRVL